MKVAMNQWYRTRKLLRRLACMGILVYILSACSNEKEWNLVFILVDDLGWNQVGYHGNSFYETPNIDKIANAGMHFRDAYAAANVCSPTRASLMTGFNPARLHITDYIPGSPFPYEKLVTPQQLTTGLPLEYQTMAELLRDEGYINGHFGKWHLNKDKKYEPGRPGDPESQGFDKDEILTTVKPKPDTDPYADPHHSQEITARSLDFIKRHKDEKFFCYTAYHAVHRPLIEEPELIAKYEAKEGADEDVNNPIMGAMIERMDTGIGQIMDLLEELELDDNTIVVFYSDNGGLEFLQDQAPLRGGKATIWEGGLRVPLAIRWPGVIAPNQISEELISSDDFFPTFAELFDRTVEGYDGVSLLPLLTGSGSIEREALYFHYPHYHHLGYKPGSAIRMGDYKLIEWYEQTLLEENGQVSLFNLREDIGEENDLSVKLPEKTAEMRKMLHTWRKEIGAQEMTVNPNHDPERAKLRFPEE